MFYPVLMSDDTVCVLPKGYKTSHDAMCRGYEAMTDGYNPSVIEAESHQEAVRKVTSNREDSREEGPA